MVLEEYSQNTHLPFGDHRAAPYYGKDVVSVKQFSKEDLIYIFAIAHEMREMVARVGTFDLLKGKILANLFYEPSTRTSSSFTSGFITHLSNQAVHRAQRSRRVSLEAGPWASWGYRYMATSLSRAFRASNILGE